MTEHSLQADLLPEEINDNDIFTAKIIMARDKRIVNLEKVKSEEKKGPRITVNIYFPNQRAYDVAWSIAKLSDYEDLDEFINDTFLKTRKCTQKVLQL